MMASCRKRNRYFFALFLAIILVTLLQLHSLVHADHNNFSFFSSKLHSTSNSYSTLSSFPNKGIILDPQQSAQLRSLFLNLKDLEKTKGRQEKEEKALALRKQMAERVRSLPSFSQENIRTNSNSSIDEYGSVSNNNNTDVPLQNVVVDNVHVIPDEVSERSCRICLSAATKHPIIFTGLPPTSLSARSAQSSNPPCLLDKLGPIH